MITLFKVAIMLGALVGVAGTLLFLEHLFPSPAWNSLEVVIACSFVGAPLGVSLAAWLARR